MLFKINLNNFFVQKIKIIIADSHFLSRKGLAMLLNDNVDFSQSWITVGAADASLQSRKAASQRDLGDSSRKNSTESKKSVSSRSLVTEEMLTTLKRQDNASTYYSG